MDRGKKALRFGSRSVSPLVSTSCRSLPLLPLLSLPGSSCCVLQSACPVCLWACWELGGETVEGERARGEACVWVCVCAGPELETNTKKHTHSRFKSTLKPSGRVVGTTFQGAHGAPWNLRDCFFLLLWWQQCCCAAPTAETWLDSLVGAALRIGPAVYPPLIQRGKREQWGAKRFLLAPGRACCSVKFFFILSRASSSLPRGHFSRPVWDASAAVGSRLLTNSFICKKFTTSFGYKKTENVHAEVQKG